MLNHHKLLIDQDCPMCRAYGRCFTQLKLVDNDTLSPYQSIDDQHTVHIDMNRAKNEIALYDKTSQHTVYGYDALVSIISQKHLSLNRLLNTPIIKWVFNQLYFLISYNRKIIVPPHSKSSGRMCIPDTQPFYRWLYIIIAALSTGYILNHFMYDVSIEIGQSYSPFREYAICIGQVKWQFFICSMIVPKKRLDYLGNMSTVSIIGGIILVPLLLLNSVITIPLFAMATYFFMVVLFMLIEHIRRCKLLDIPLAMTYSWITFRIFVLITLLII